MGVYLKIRAERKKMNMTQEQLAEKIGVSTKTIVNWENDIAMPRLENCQRLRSLFEITLDDLLEGSFELKDKYDDYVDLGKKILELANVDNSVDFIQNNYICSREPSLVIPRKVAEKFISDIGEKMNTTEIYDIERMELIQKNMRDFLFFWHKYNKGKYLLARNLKMGTLFMNSVSYTDEEIENQLKNSMAQEKPILLLRNLMISRLINQCNLFEFITDEEIKEELDYSGEIMWPVATYK